MTSTCHAVFCSEVIDNITDANSGCLGCDLGWFRCSLGITWQVNVITNKNAFTFDLKLLIISWTQFLGV